MRFSLALALAGALAATPLILTTPAFASHALASQAADDAAEPSEAQRRLTEKDVANFLAASRAVEPLVARLPEDTQAEPDEAALAELDKAAQQAGLKDYADYDQLAANLSFLLQGFDPETKAFVGHKARLEAEIARVKDDSSLSKRERAEALRELNADGGDVDEVTYPQNVPLVAKRYDELSAVLHP